MSFSPQIFETDTHLNMAHGNNDMVEKLVDGGEEIYCWSGPPKRKRSPMICDEPIGCFEPMMRLPRRQAGTRACPNPNAKSTSVNMSSGVSSNSSVVARNHMQHKRQKVVDADNVDIVHIYGKSGISTG